MVFHQRVERDLDEEDEEEEEGSRFGEWVVRVWEVVEVMVGDFDGVVDGE